MFRQMVFVQWKASRWGLFLLAMVCFGFPLLLLRVPGMESADPSGLRNLILNSQGSVLPAFPMIAAWTGAILAVTAWSWDQAGKHIYALALPMHRWEYVLLKFGAGTLMMLIPTITLLAGGLLAIAQLDLPEGLRAYPVAFAGRFFLASLITYSLVFAFCAAHVQTAARVFAVLVAVLVGGSIIVEFLTQNLGVRGLISPFDLLVIAFTQWPGPFHVFAGNWMLIDV